MSTEDTIVVNIDDTQLSQVLLRLDAIGTEAQRTTGRKRLDLALPGINRELRLILGQLPAMREAMRAYFALKRVERGAAYLAIGEKLPAILTAVATLIILLNFVMDRQRQLMREQQQYQAFLMRERGWTRDELRANYSRVHNYMRSMPG